MRPLKPREASDYLIEKYGIRRSFQTLAKLRVVGGGPLFRKAGRDVLYEQADLDRFAAQILTPAVRSTSELAEQSRKGPSSGVAAHEVALLPSEGGAQLQSSAPALAPSKRAPAVSADQVR